MTSRSLLKLWTVWTDMRANQQADAPELELVLTVLPTVILVLALVFLTTERARNTLPLNGDL